MSEFRARCELSFLATETNGGNDQLGQRLFARLTDRKLEQYVHNVSELVLLLAAESNSSPGTPARLTSEGEQVVSELRKYLSMPSARTVNTFNSVVLRLVKLVHSAIESDRGCFTFYQIFSNIFIGTNNEGLDNTDFGSKVMKELKILINSLASFDRNIGDVFNANQQQQRCREEQISGSSTTSGYGRCSTTTSPGMESLEGHGSPTIFGSGLSHANMAQLKHPIAMNRIGTSETTTPSTTVSTDYTLVEQSLLSNNNTFGLVGGGDTLGDLPPSLASPSPLPSDLARIRFRNNSGYTSNGSGGSFSSPTIGTEFSLLKDNVVGGGVQSEQQTNVTTPGGSSLFNDFADFASGVVETTDFSARPILGGNTPCGSDSFTTLSGVKNQCYTITMNQQQHGNMSKASLMKGNLSAQLSPFSDDYLMSDSPQAKAGGGINATDRLDKDHLYRLIIG